MLGGMVGIIKLKEVYTSCNYTKVYTFNTFFDIRLLIVGDGIGKMGPWVSVVVGQEGYFLLKVQ